MQNCWKKIEDEIEVEIAADENDKKITSHFFNVSQKSVTKKPIIRSET